MQKFFSISLLLFFFATSQTFAASQDECAIWLCLPAGFPSGCAGAKHAFVHRIKHLKPPLPDIAACLYKGNLPNQTDTDIQSNQGVAAYIPPKTVCTQRKIDIWGEPLCTHTETKSSQIIKDTKCEFSAFGPDPANCQKTLNYVEINLDQKQTGKTYFFDDQGNSYSPGAP